MGKTLKKYLLFDLDTTALKEEFGPKRYTVVYPPGNQAHQGEVKPRPARGIPVAQEPHTDALDEQLLRVDRGRCTARAGEEIHRETEGGLADGTRIQIPNLPE